MCSGIRLDLSKGSGAVVHCVAGWGAGARVWRVARGVIPYHVCAALVRWKSPPGVPVTLQRMRSVFGLLSIIITRPRSNPSGSAVRAALSGPCGRHLHRSSGLNTRAPRILRTRGCPHLPKFSSASPASVCSPASVTFTGPFARNDDSKTQADVLPRMSSAMRHGARHRLAPKPAPTLLSSRWSRPLSVPRYGKRQGSSQMACRQHHSLLCGPPLASSRARPTSQMERRNGTEGSYRCRHRRSSSRRGTSTKRRPCARRAGRRGKAQVSRLS